MSSKAIREYFRQVAEEGNTQAFRAIYEHYFKRLLHFSFSIVGSKESAEEIVNDVFLKVWNRRSSLLKIKNPDVYFYVAIKNKSLDYLKSPSSPVANIDDINESNLKTTVNPESIMVSNELHEKIRNAVDELPPRCKLIFKLVKEDGLKYKEAASILGLSLKTVENQLAIAVKKLSKVLLRSSSQNNHQEIN